MTRVMVGLSGGVDSAVAAARLLDLDYEVIGVFIKVWHPTFLPCNWEQERRDAMRVAAHLGIPFLTCDAQQEYYQEVATYFINAYQAGLTPNPDVMCNRAIKFGAFWQFAQTHKVDFIATGHYAQIKYDSNGPQLWRGRDTDKDQSYFLWTLTRADLAHTLLPIGDTTKEVIRAEARLRGVPVAKKPDSQGICFLGQVDVPEFLSHYVDLQSGAVHNKTGQAIGTHQGSICYTVGQRHGFDVTDSDHSSTPLYVHSLDHERNVIVVDSRPPQTPTGSMLTLVNYNLLTQLQIADDVLLQIRYRQDPIKATVHTIDEKIIKLKLHEHMSGAAAGQSCVLYQEDQCLGGGIIHG